MTPWEDLAAHWRGLGQPVQETITAQIDAPGIVLVPGDPWLEPRTMSIDPERYNAVAVVTGSDASSAQRSLHRLIHFIRHNLPAGWRFEQASRPNKEEHQGLTYFWSECALVLEQCTEGDPYNEGASSS